MSEVTMDEISIQIEGNSDKAIESLTKLTEVLDKLTKATGDSLAGLQQTNKKIAGISESIEKSDKKTLKSFEGMGKSALSFITKLTGVKLGFLDTTNYMLDYISSANRFNYTFSTTQQQLKETTEWVNNLSDAWLLDNKVVADSMSRYYNMTKTMGIASDEALTMSKNLTMLTYDLSAFWGDSTSRVTTRIASAMRGEAEGLAEYGISLNQATLQATLYANGINKTVSSLTAAQKAELVYYQIMKSTANQHGYYAKTLLQPANALEILKTQFTKFGRAIGSIFLPMLMAAMPYVIALTELLTKLAQTIASFFGFELGDWTSDTTQIGAGLDNIGDSAEQAGKKVKGMLGDFDELHTINFGDTTGSLSAMGGSLGLDASEFEYTDELMSVIDEKLEHAREVIANIKDYIIAIGIALASFTIAKGVLNFFGNLFGADKTIMDNIFGIAVGIGLIAGGAFLMGDALIDIYNNGLTLKNGVELLIGVVGTFVGWMIVLNALKKIDLYSKLFGNANILKVAGGLTLIIGALVVFVAALGEAAKGGEEGAKGMAVALGAMAVAALGFTIVGMPVIATIIAIAGGVLLLIGMFQTLVQAIQAIKDPTVEIKNPLENLSDNFKTLTEAVGGFTDGLTEDFSNTSSSIVDNLGIIDESTSGTVNNLNGYLNGDLAKTLDESELDFKEYEDFLKERGLNIDLATADSFKSIEDSITSKTREAAKNGGTYFDDLAKDIEDANKELKDDTKNTMRDLSKEIDNATKDMNADTGKWKGYLERGNQAQIKTPSFSWKQAVNTGLSTMLRTVLTSLGLPLLLPRMNVDWFAEGGFPTKGDLFIANEAGAEWVGSMNGRTAVANQDQITSGIAQAAYEGMARALSEHGGGDVNVYNYLDSKDIASKMTRIKKSNANMYG